ncbi:YidC/Oxa1 family membrane protein insertase [Herbihabitans rhizosphaerae]|uniref:Membrane protein insertase YidC n=1 Tax=Herbihabitans rhizosphaerae TaxID=1872711 RepID=A0A4Q7KLQ5_9PSEU|nr:membrane protein insertase YidC [Herbihabitans rhizosphaerae]RZS37598.1 YidC/Oxa1 family membrane protein insertase [Herbihabitans rhizosphaerae]
MLNFIYYPVSFILWCWHWVFGHIFGPSNGVTWVLSIMFLVFTLRAIMFKPFVKQVRSMRKMQEFAPELKKIQKKYANDRQKQAQEMQKLQSQHGFNPLGGCLPMLLQIPVFIGLFHVLRSFGPGKNENYFFDKAGNQSYMDASIFGANLSNFVSQPVDQIRHLGGNQTAVIAVGMIAAVIAGVLTHLTARHSVSRQNPASATSQTNFMNKITLWVFPVGVVVGAAFFPFPIGLLVYWLANNSWTLMQQHFVYRKIDAEEKEQKAQAVEKKTALAPKPGQKPNPKKRPAGQTNTPKPGQKPKTDSTKSDDTAKPTDSKSASAGKSTGSAKPSSTPKPKASPNGASAPDSADAKPGEVPGIVNRRGKKQSRKRR